MKNNFLLYTSGFIVAAALLFSSCNKNYIIGGDTVDLNQFKNKSVYEALQSNHTFDTLRMLIDSCPQLRDSIDQPNITYLAVPNSLITSYLQKRQTWFWQNVSTNISYTIDSLIKDLRIRQTLRDSMMMYVVHQALPYDSLTEIGAIYPTAYAKETVALSYESSSVDPTKAGSGTSQGYNPNVSTTPRVVYIARMLRAFTITPSNPIKKMTGTDGTRMLCPISGMVTKNGVIYSLPLANYSLFYN
jgi:hypothetical protein